MTTLSENGKRFTARRGSVAISTIAVLFVALPAKAQTKITACPFTIATAGNYELANDITCPSGDGITITVHGEGVGVTLNLNNHKIIAGSLTSQAAIHVSPSSGRADHVGIFGPGLITNDGTKTFKTGISVNAADFSQISQVTIEGTAGTGIAGFGCRFLKVASNIVGNTSAPNPGEGDGVDLVGGGSSMISGNYISGNVSGIYLDGEYLPGPNADPNVVSSNIVISNFADGISLTNFRPAGARIYGNVINGNGGFGINILPGGSPVQVFSNTSAANKIDLRDGDPDCHGNVWGNNVFFTRDPSGSGSCVH